MHSSISIPQPRPDLQPGAEIIRWQSPFMHVCRMAVRTSSWAARKSARVTKLSCGTSPDCDEEAIDYANGFIIDQARPRHHLSFEFSAHCCVDNCFVQVQFITLWEEILERFPVIELIEELRRIYSNLIHGITEMKVRIPA